MLASSIPTKFQIPFANSAPGTNIQAIPQASQIGTTIGAASLTDGFPPVCLLPVGAGGVPPWGRDMNGILNQVSAWCRWQAAGSPVKYDSTFQSGISGYPQGAVVQSATTLGAFWFSTADANTTNPDTGGAGWIAFPAGQGLVGDFRYLTGSANGTALTAQWTVSEIIAKTAVGGPAFLGSNLTLTFNGAATAGAGAMDTGTLSGGTGTSAGGTAVGTYFSVYAIYNGTAGTWNTLGTLAGSGLVYTGSAMPAGYVASTLIFTGQCGGSGGGAAGGQINPFYQNDRVIYCNPTLVYSVSGTANPVRGAWNAFSVASVVPPNGRSCGGVANTPTQTQVSLAIQPLNQIDTFGFEYGLGEQSALGQTSAQTGATTSTFWSLPCPNRQLYFQSVGSVSGQPNIAVTSYTI